MRVKIESEGLRVQRVVKIRVEYEASGPYEDCRVECLVGLKWGSGEQVDVHSGGFARLTVSTSENGTGLEGQISRVVSNCSIETAISAVDSPSRCVVRGGRERLRLRLSREDPAHALTFLLWEGAAEEWSGQFAREADGARTCLHSTTTVHLQRRAIDVAYNSTKIRNDPEPEVFQKL